MSGTSHRGDGIARHLDIFSFSDLMVGFSAGEGGGGQKGKVF